MEGIPVICTLEQGVLVCGGVYWGEYYYSLLAFKHSQLTDEEKANFFMFPIQKTRHMLVVVVVVLFWMANDAC